MSCGKLDDAVAHGTGIAHYKQESVWRLFFSLLASFVRFGVSVKQVPGIMALYRVKQDRNSGNKMQQQNLKHTTLKFAVAMSMFYDVRVST